MSTVAAIRAPTLALNGGREAGIGLATGDGEMAEFAFGEANQRSVIGQRYAVKDSEGRLRPATLVTAVFDESGKQAMCGFNFDGGGSEICSAPLSDAESRQA